ncbi:MAG: hypothetical protein R6X02_16195 [Enhygromyxa sp.]
MSPRPLVLLAALLTLAACEERYPPMPEVWVDPELSYQGSDSLPPATDEGLGPEGSLLASYAERQPRADEELETWVLPFQAKTMVVELLIGAAKDDPERVLSLLTQNARWGLPDRREIRARPISTQDDPLGLEFLAAFRKATSRFSKKASFTCTPLQPGWQVLAAAGAEPVWCLYTSADNLDIIGFRMIMEGGRQKTDYVGFFPERQTQLSHIANADLAPPQTPYVKRPVSLELPELMPDGSNPVLERPARRAQPADLDAPIPVPAPGR